jgi:hypothetical protein
MSEPTPFRALRWPYVEAHHEISPEDLPRTRLCCRLFARDDCNRISIVILITLGVSEIARLVVSGPLLTP